MASFLMAVLIAGVLVATTGVSDSHAPHVSLSASSSYEEVHPGDQASFMLTLRNEGESQENVTLEEASPQEVQVSFLDGRTWSVPANGSQEVELLARVDAGASEGARSVNVDAFVGNASAANVTLTVDVVDPPAQIALDPSPWERDVTAGEQVDYIMTVHNHGDREDQVALRARAPENVSVTFPGGDARTIPAGESSDILLRAYVEPSTPEDRRAIEVRALARGQTQASVNLALNIVEDGDPDPDDDPEESPEETTETQPEANETEDVANETLRLSVPDDEATVAPGGKTTFPVELTNRADLPLAVELRRNSDAQISIRMVGGVHREVPAEGSDNVDVEVSVHDDTAPGRRTVIIYAIGENDTLDSLRLTVNVDEPTVEGADEPEGVDTPGPSVALIVVGSLLAAGWSSKRRRSA